MKTYHKQLDISNPTELGQYVHRIFEDESSTLDIPNASGNNEPMPYPLAIVIALMFVIAASALGYAMYLLQGSLVVALVVFAVCYVVLLALAFTAISGDMAPMFDSWQRNRRLIIDSQNKTEVLTAWIEFLKQHDTNRTDVARAEILATNRAIDAQEAEVLNRRRNQQLVVNEENAEIHQHILAWLDQVYDDPDAIGRNNVLRQTCPWNEGGAWAHQPWRIKARDKLIAGPYPLLTKRGTAYALRYNTKQEAYTAHRRL